MLVDMKKIKDYLIKYFKNSSWFKIVTDLLFYMLILSLLIPATRIHVSAMLIRATMMSPKVKSVENSEKLKQEDYLLSLEDLDGNPVNLADFKGEVLFINFWATWCPPCRAEMPSMQEFCDRHGSDLKIFLITNEERDKVKSYLDEYGFHLPVYFQRSVAHGVFNIRSLPTSFVIGKNGEIFVNKKGAARWDSKGFEKKLKQILAH